MKRISLNQPSGLTLKSDLLKKKLLQPTIKPLGLKRSLEFVSSGSWIINLAITGNADLGFPVGRVSTIAGPKGVGKTLVACEVVNATWYLEHLQKNKKVKLYFDEPEAAFDYKLADRFGMPLDQINGLRENLTGFKVPKGEKAFVRSRKVEDVYNNIQKIIKEESGYDIIVYVLDSLDALSDSSEIKHMEKKGIDKQGMGGTKARILSQMFRNMIQDVNESNVLFLILQQIRENVGVMYGKKFIAGGGKAVEHYASVMAWFYETGPILAKNNFVQGIECDVELTKNKVGGQKYYRTPLSILHGYGIDNFSSAINFLWDQKGIEIEGSYINWNGKKYHRAELIEKIANGPDYDKDQLKAMLQNHWNKMVKEAEITRKPKWS